MPDIVDTLRIKRTEEDIADDESSMGAGIVIAGKSYVGNVIIYDKTTYPNNVTYIDIDLRDVKKVISLEFGTTSVSEKV